jgi:hypothetical protein
MNKNLSHYIIFINTYIRISFRVISLRWTYKHRYAEFINNESKQKKKGMYNKYINSFYLNPLSKKN